MRISLHKLEKLVMELLRQEYSTHESTLIKDVIMFGELSGKSSHGLLRLLNKDSGAFVNKARKKPQYIRRTSISTLIEGHNNPGMLVAQLAKKEVTDIATKHGFGIVGTKGSVGSTGAVAYYCLEVAKHGLITIIFTQSSPRSAPLVAAFNSRKALFGTNPISFGIPNTPHPVIFDMSTSATTFGDIAQYAQDGKKLSDNVAIDAEGNRTNDPHKALRGAVLPFDRSYKGSGLAMMMELLGAVLPGANFCGLFPEFGQGNVIMAFKPDLLSDADSFQQRLHLFLEHLKDTPTQNGTMRLPGEFTVKKYFQALSNNYIDISKDMLIALNNKLKILSNN